jgi:chromate reductase
LSRILVHSLAARQKAPVKMSVYDIGEVPLYNQDLDGDNPPAPVKAFKDAIAAADGLVIVTPEYNYGIPGVLKNAIDWASRPAFNSVLKGKPVLPVSCSPAYTGAARALGQLKLLLLATLSDVVPGPEVVIAEVHNKIRDGRFLDESNLEFAQGQIDALIRMVHEKRRRVG